jgi:voltage-gated potassium channel
VSLWNATRRRRWLVPLANLVAVLCLYFAVPVGTGGRLVIGLLVSAGAIAAVTLLIVREAQAQRTDSQYTVRLVRLLLLLEVVMAAFALGYYILAQVSGQFEGIETRVDALYFTIVTMGTVGYGDVHPVGQLARVVVMLNILFDVVFLAALARLAGSQLQHRGRI